MSATMPGSKLLAPTCILPLALLASLLFSLLLTLNHPQLNDDAFSYLRAAERAQQEGSSVVLQDYGWYGYSLLIALADRLLPGGLATSAHVLNALSYLLLTGTFLALQRESGARPRQQLLAAAVVLLFPLLNEMRHFIIRDVACWAFSLLALLQLTRLARAPSLARAAPLALAWCASMLFAAVFRLEALLPAFLAPLALLASRSRQGPGTQGFDGRHATVLLYASLAACLTVALLLSLAAGMDLPGLMGFAWRYYLPLLLDLGSVLRDDAMALNAALFTPENFPGTENVAIGLLILLFGYVASVLLNLAEALGLPFTLLLLFGWHQRLGGLPAAVAVPWLGYAVPALLALLLFQLIMHFQTQRYAALLALLLLLWLPGFLEQWWQRAEQQGSARRLRLLLGLLCCYCAVDSLVSFGYSKRHIEAAGQWVEQELPAGARLATNSFQLAWRSGRIVDYDKTQRDVSATLQGAAAADYVVLDLKHGDTAARSTLEQLRELTLVTAFSNERGDEVRVYRRTAP